VGLLYTSSLRFFIHCVVFVAGWEYRHWDAMLLVLAEAAIELLGNSAELKADRSPHAVIQKNWAAVFASGKHETVDVWAEDKSITVLTLLLTGASKVLVPFCMTVLSNHQS
jgi:hypothetical protein